MRVVVFFQILPSVGTYKDHLKSTIPIRLLKARQLHSFRMTCFLDMNHHLTKG